MVGMIVTTGQMGVSCFQGSIAFASNCSSSNAVSSSGLFLHWRPSFGIDFKLNNGLVKRGRVVQALLEGGSDGKSVGGAILEKESEFKRSFDEYLKVMETVKTVRDKRQEGTGSEKLREMPLADGNGKGVKLSVFEGRFENEKKPRAVEKDGSFKGRDGFKKQDSTRKKVGELNERSGSKQKSSLGTTKSVQGRETADRERPKQSTRVVEEREEDEEDIDDYNWGMRSRIENKARSSETFEKERTNDSHWGYRSSSEVVEKKRIDVGSNKSREGFERSRARNGSPSDERPNRRTEAFGKKGEDKSLNVERAAFRYLGKEDSCLKDGRQRPRAEMDEKIQKLAKSLNGAALDMPEWMFAKMMRSAQIIFTDHSISRVIQILGKFGNWRRVLQVIEWIQIRERFESHKLRYVYTTALYVLGKERRPVEALNVFNAMLEQMSSYPDLVAYRSIAVTLGQAGHMEELFDVMDIMRSPPKKVFKTGALGKWDPRLEPDIIVYNAVLNACVQQKQWEGAFWVMQQLEEKDMKPSVTTHGLFMEVMYACGKYNLVHEFFKRVQKISIPNALTYRVVVNTLWKEGKLDEAVQAVQEMETRGVVGSAALYYDFARCLCSVGRSREALMQIEKICKVANKPLVVTYTGLIQACLDSGNIKDATYIFNHMKDFCSPNLVTCNIMLKGYLNRGMFEKGEMMFREMLEDANGIKAKERGRVLVAPDIYTFNTFLEACVAEKRWDEFEYAFKKMFYHGFHFNSRRHLHLIMAASRAGREELVEETWSHLVETGRSPPPSLAKERFCVKLERGDYACALHCISSQNLTRLPDFSKKAWSRLLGENPAKFQRSTIDRLIHEINDIATRTEQPNPLLDNLLASCEEFSRTSLEAVNVKPPQSFTTSTSSL